MKIFNFLLFISLTSCTAEHICDKLDREHKSKINILKSKQEYDPELLNLMERMHKQVKIYERCK